MTAEILILQGHSFGGGGVALKMKRIAVTCLS